MSLLQNLIFKKEIGRLIKLYFRFTNEKEADKTICQLVSDYQKTIGIVLDEFSLNYKKNKKINLLKSTSMSVSDFISFMSFTESDDYGLDISAPPRKNGVDFFEISFFFKSSFDNDKKIVDLIKNLNISILYGYGRNLPINYSRVSENKIKKSIFGSSIQGRLFGSDWIDSPEKIHFAGIKGIYPYNFVNKNVLELPVIKKIIADPAVTVTSLNENISCIKIPKEILASLRKENRDIKEYIRD